MKRYDPAYEALASIVRGPGDRLRYVSVEVNDPDAWPFIKHHAWRQGDDVVPELIASLKVKQQEQVARAQCGVQMVHQVDERRLVQTAAFGQEADAREQLLGFRRRRVTAPARRVRAERRRATGDP